MNFVLPKFHYELPRLFDRVPFVAYNGTELEVGFGARSVMLGKWFIALSD